eukprot:UN23905
METGRKYTATSIFRAGSLSQPLVATAIMQMVEKKQLKLGDQISKYLKEFKIFKRRVLVQDAVDNQGHHIHITEPAKSKITIKHLLTAHIWDFTWRPS